MNGIATFRAEYWPGRCLFATHHPAPSCGSARQETMTSAMAAFGIAVGGSSLICRVLIAEPPRKSRIVWPDRTAAMLPVAAEASPVGSAATTPRQIVRAIRAMQAEAEVTEAIDAAHRRTRSSILIYRD